MYEAVERKGVDLHINFANRAGELDMATNYVLRELRSGYSQYRYAPEAGRAAGR